MENYWFAIIAAVKIFVLVSMIKTRNRFEVLRRAVQAEKSTISVYVEKRADCIRDALNVIKTTYKLEVESIAKLTQNEQVNQLAHLGQKYPELGNSAIYGHLVKQTMVLNDDIAAARVLLIGNIDTYNSAITAIPANIVAFLFGYKKETLIDEETLEEHKKLKKTDVDFSQF